MKLSGISKRYFSVTAAAKYRTGISNDLVVSASMGWSSKVPMTHLEHFQAIKSMGL
jgi:hypothetical protein